MSNIQSPFEFILQSPIFVKEQKFDENDDKLWTNFSKIFPLLEFIMDRTNIYAYEKLIKINKSDMSDKKRFLYQIKMEANRYTVLS